MQVYVCQLYMYDGVLYMSIRCVSLKLISPTAPPEATSEIVPEFSHTNSTCGTTQQELGQFE